MKNIFFALGTIVLLAITITILPIDKINWGRISILPAATITVTGSAQGNVANQLGTFSATVMVSNANKQTAVDSVNTKMTALIKAVKDFGIADSDIKTESVSVYQMPVRVPETGSTGSGTSGSGATTLIYPVPPQVSGNGDWQASNSITITLKDITKASGLSDILNKSGATNVYGPNFTVDNSTQSDTELLSKAVADAKSKAESIAKAGNQTVGKMINVQEGGANYPMPLYATKDAATVGTPIQPGTSTLYKNVTVTFELK